MTFLLTAIVMSVIGLLAFTLIRLTNMRVIGPRHVLRHVSNAHVPYSVKTGWLTTFWIPGGQDLDVLRMGKGTVTYWSDEQGAVHLDIQPEAGPPQHFSAPPPFLRSSPLRRRRPR